MRLASLTGFELRGLQLHSLSNEETVSHVKLRLMLFTPEQAKPVYISEEFTSNSTSNSLREVSFREHFCRRSFRVALQLWGDLEDWRVLESWSLDLRQAKPLTTTRNHISTGLTIFADSGHLHLPFSIGDETETRESHSRTNSVETGQVETPASEETSLLSRWILWPRTGLNGSSSKAGYPLSNSNSLSYPTLVDLWTLQRSLDEARVASIEMADQSNNALSSSSLFVREKEAILKKRIKIIRKHTENLRLETLKRSNQATHNRYFQKSLTSSLDESTSSFSQFIQAKADTALTSSASIATEVTDASAPDLAGQILFEQGRLASELLDVFPIELVEDKTFHFTICGLMLPSVFAINHYDTTQIGAALGFVAQVLVCLSKYLDVPLPYPITVFGSQSYITDNITKIKHGSNRFPLWTRGALLYRVEYGLYLLHKDIEQLMNSLDLAVADLKQTLANLKNVLLVLASQCKQKSSINK